MINHASNYNPASRAHHDFLKGTADIIDEVSDELTYLGFFMPANANEATATASVCRIQKTATITRIMWANGNFMFNNIWNNRASLTYTYKNF